MTKSKVKKVRDYGCAHFINTAWEDEKKNIEAMIKTGASCTFLGMHYGVSRQRMHQVLQTLKLVKK